MELSRAFYRDADAYQRFVWTFNHDQSRFDFDALLRELGQVGDATGPRRDGVGGASAV